jgi:hypothetical protein
MLVAGCWLLDHRIVGTTKTPRNHHVIASEKPQIAQINADDGIALCAAVFG